MRLVPARAALLGALFAAIVTLPGLGNGTLWDNSETAYGEVAHAQVSLPKRVHNPSYHRARVPKKMYVPAVY